MSTALVRHVNNARRIKPKQWRAIWANTKRPFRTVTQINMDKSGFFTTSKIGPVKRAVKTVKNMANKKLEGASNLYSNLKENIKSGRAKANWDMASARLGKKAIYETVKTVSSRKRKAVIGAGLGVGGAVWRERAIKKNQPKLSKAHGTKLQKIGDTALAGAASGAIAGAVPTLLGPHATLLFGPLTGMSWAASRQHKRAKKAGYFKEQVKLNKIKKQKALEKRLRHEEETRERIRRV